MYELDSMLNFSVRVYITNQHTKPRLFDERVHVLWWYGCNGLRVSDT